MKISSSIGTILVLLLTVTRSAAETADAHPCVNKNIDFQVVAASVSNREAADFFQKNIKKSKGGLVFSDYFTFRARGASGAELVLNSKGTAALGIAKTKKGSSGVNKVVINCNCSGDGVCVLVRAKEADDALFCASKSCKGACEPDMEVIFGDEPIGKTFQG